MYGHTTGGDTVGDGVLSNVDDEDKVAEPNEVAVGLVVNILLVENDDEMVLGKHPILAMSGQQSLN